jgi:C1A family cysteine protease
MAIKIKGFGRRKDFNDPRDYTPESQSINKIFNKALDTTLSKRTAKTISSSTPLPTSVDNRKWCTPVSDQGNLGSCTANAGVSMYEYMERKAYGSASKFIDGSRLFLYKLTRFLMGEEGKGDSGAYIRTTLGAIRMFGIPPEQYHPYTDKDPDFDKEPVGAVYSLAKEYQSVAHFRIDYSKDTEENIKRMKEYVAKGFALQIGFTVYSSYKQADKTGAFPYPTKSDGVEGGHSVLTVGYDDNLTIPNKTDNSTTTGAFLIQNSWGTGWGDKGYGWIPYAYFRIGANGDVLADDVWCLLKVEWLSTGEFYW